jgi:hypothetical protein
VTATTANEVNELVVTALDVGIGIGSVGASVAGAPVPGASV